MAERESVKFLLPSCDGENIKLNAQIVVGDGTRTFHSEEITADLAHHHALKLLEFEAEIRRRE